MSGQPSADDLIAATLRTDIAAVASMLATDPSLALARNMFGVSALHAAHYASRGQIFHLLCDRGQVTIDPFLAAELGDVAALRAALEQDQSLAAAWQETGATALHQACYWGNVEGAALLLDAGADANAPTRDPFLHIRPLGCAVATPNIPNPSDDERVVLSLVNLLLDHGADVNGRRGDGMTALHAAAYRGLTDVIRLLLERGADPSIRATAGAHAAQTPLDTAVSQQQTAAASLLRSRDIGAAEL
jgi:ankyrin repeat protein